MTDQNMTGRDAAGRFATGNRIWEARSSVGANPKFESAEDLKAACVEYFNWNDANPLMSAEKLTFQGKGSSFNIPKMRAMSVAGLCNFIGITRATWYLWKGDVSDQPNQKRTDLLSIIAWAEGVIFQQKFEGASANLLNANIIARELGISDKRELTGKDGGPIASETTVKPDFKNMPTFQLKYFELYMDLETPFYDCYLKEFEAVKRAGGSEESIDVHKVIMRAVEKVKNS